MRHGNSPFSLSVSGRPSHTAGGCGDSCGTFTQSQPKSSVKNSLISPGLELIQGDRPDSSDIEQISNLQPTLPPSLTLRLADWLDAAERIEGYLIVYRSAPKVDRVEMRTRLTQCRIDASRLLAIEYRAWERARRSREMVTAARRLIPAGWGIGE